MVQVQEKPTKKASQMGHINQALKPKTSRATSTSRTLSSTMNQKKQPPQQLTLTEKLLPRRGQVDYFDLDREEDVRNKRLQKAKEQKAKKQEDHLKRLTQDAIAESAQEQMQEIASYPAVKINVNAFSGTKLTWKNTLTCGDCEGLNIRHIRFEQAVCSRRGITGKSSICSRFSPLPPSAFIATPKESDALFNFSEMLAQFPDDKISHLIGLMWVEKRTRKYGFRFFQKLYYRWKGCSTDNYYGNFIAGYLVSVTTKVVRLTNRNATAMISIYLDGDSTILKGEGPSFFTEYSFRTKIDPIIRGKTDSETNDRLERRRLNGLELPLDDIAEPATNVGDNSASSSPPAKDKKKAHKVLGVDDLLSLSCSTDESKFDVKPLKPKSKVRDLVAITSELSRTMRRVDTGYYNTGNDDTDVVTDSGLEDYYAEQEDDRVIAEDDDYQDFEE